MAYLINVGGKNVMLDDFSKMDGAVVEGDLALSLCTVLSKLPNKLTVNGNCLLNKSSLKVLPEDFTINGDLNISKTDITTIPASLVCTGKIISDHPVTREVSKALELYDSLF